MGDFSVGLTMLKTKFKPLERGQFALLREAKRLISDEYGKEISLQDKDILDQIYGYALDSKSDRLYEIFNDMHASISDDQTNDTDKDNNGVVQGNFKKVKKQTTKRKQQ